MGAVLHRKAFLAPGIILFSKDLFLNFFLAVKNFYHIAIFFLGKFLLNRLFIWQICSSSWMKLYKTVHIFCHRSELPFLAWPWLLRGKRPWLISRFEISLFLALWRPRYIWLAFLYIPAQPFWRDWHRTRANGFGSFSKIDTFLILKSISKA